MIVYIKSIQNHLSDRSEDQPISLRPSNVLKYKVVDTCILTAGDYVRDEQVCFIG